ncbi:glutamate--tRNA ligase [Mycoplasma sp. SG1]|uniref:glutamate--tRNA ligase n=1 Tax=Mycoplasma sp. SG1 TaxID=2810348 RepID=UPI002023F04D|nr:glutamate--tRNA ligase family protein [Mycoplasma sp. SG1]URM52821.1 glutamate--tRNA ligase [Mycoplasma sp. SG1]
MKNQKIIRTRFAPSPTGELHVGGARTALFNYLYAKHNNGLFILRIEDTDLDRNQQKSFISLYEDLIWLKIIPDESHINPNPKYGSYFQSERKDIYLKLAKQLIDQGLAYYSSASNNNHLNKEGIAIRLKVKKDIILSWDDGVLGETKINSNELNDFVLIKSDQTPSYNFANVIDDKLFEITDVIRGQEHVSNTPKQLLIYKYLNWEPPRYIHLPLIVDKTTKKKLSKRNENVVQTISQFKDQNYLPEAVNNFLLFLGWYSTEKELFSLEEMIKKFTIKNLNKASASFDMDKLLWFNQEHLKAKDDKIFIKETKEWFLKNNIYFTETIKKGLIYLKPQLKKIDLFLTKGDVFFDVVEYDKEVINFLNEQKNYVDQILEITNQAKIELEKSDFSLNSLKKITEKLLQLFVGSKKTNKILFFKTLRIATTKKLIGSPIIDLWQILGKRILLSRIEEFKHLLNNKLL